MDDALKGSPRPATDRERYELEMAFSRGQFSGWMHGVNHQKLVGAYYGKKRGPLVGTITRVIDEDTIELDTLDAGIKPGDGVVFENLRDTNAERGGAVYEMRGRVLSFQHGRLRMDEIPWARESSRPVIPPSIAPCAAPLKKRSLSANSAAWPSA
jgi:putative protease